mgnify:CR=1 FL=1
MKQKPFTKPQLAKLRANAELRDSSRTQPVVKFFCPWGAATWLISELMEDGDTMFGLCDLGMGEPELGYVSLSELRSIRGPFGLTIERDIHFTPNKTLADYAEEANTQGRIVA